MQSGTRDTQSAQFGNGFELNFFESWAEPDEDVRDVLESIHLHRGQRRIRPAGGFAFPSATRTHGDQTRPFERWKYHGFEVAVAAAKFLFTIAVLSYLDRSLHSGESMETREVAQADRVVNAQV